MKNVRHLRFAATGSIREEEYQGRKHLVVPVVALVEGVIQTMNSENPELVTAQEFAEAPQGWNGRPVFLGHPMQKDRPVSGNSPKLLDDEQIGTIFNAAVKKNKLLMEAWIDVEKAEKVAPELLERIATGDPIEVSVGVFVSMEDTEGEYAGKKYKGAWRSIVPDHLALLPEGVEGACSREMGCGVRAARGATMSKPNFLTRILSALRTAQPADEMSSNDLNVKLSKALQQVERGYNYIEAFKPVTDPTSVVFSVYEQSGAYGPESSMGYQYCLYERDFTLDKDGTVALGESRKRVEPVLIYEEVPEPVVASTKTDKNAAQGAPCSCHGNAPKSATEPKEQNMADANKTTRVSELISKLNGKGFTPADQAFLETASDEQLGRLEQLIPAPVAAPVAAQAPAKVEEPKVAAKVDEPKAKTEAEILAMASPEMRDAMEQGLKVGRERKAATIKSLKASGRCDLTDEQMNGMPQTELDKLVKLADVKVAVDYSGAGTPRPQDAKQDEVPAPPSLTDAVKAAQKK